MSQNTLRTPRESLQEYGRGVAGGLIFSLPLLFTQEVWIAGATSHPARLLAFVIFIFALLLLYNRFVGLRESEASWLECAIDSVEELGLGLLLAAFVLWLLGQLNEAGPGEIWPLVLVEGLVVAIGFSVGTAQLGGAQNSETTPGENRENGKSPDEESQNEKSQPENAQPENARCGSAFFSQLAIALCGATLFVSNIAPTEEVLLVGTGATRWQLLLMALCSFGGGAYLLYFSEFRGSKGSFAQQGWLEFVVGATTSYTVALLASALLLYFFGRFDDQTAHTNFAQIIAAGVAGSLGASAGRLLLQIDQNGSK